MSSTTRLHPLRRLAPTLRRQHGVVTTAQACDVGVSTRELGHLLATGLLASHYQGVSVALDVPDSWEQQALVAQYAAGPRAAISHLAAAHLHGLTHLGAGRPAIAITVPRGSERRRGPTVRTSLTFDPVRHTVRTGPFTLTAMLWTLASLGADVHEEKLGRVYDAATAAGRVTLESLDDEILRWAFVPGVVASRAAVQRLLPEFLGTRSDGERQFLRIMRAIGFPLPLANVRVIDADGKVRYLDFAFVAYGIAIEIDIHPDHARTIGRSLDGTRQNALVDTWTLLRFDEHDLFVTPHLVAATVRRTLRAPAPTSDPRRTPPVSASATPWRRR